MLSLHDLIDTTICHFKLFIEQKNGKQTKFAGHFFKKTESCR